MGVCGVCEVCMGVCGVCDGMLCEGMYGCVWCVSGCVWVCVCVWCEGVYG